MSDARSLDQFFTHPAVARQCWSFATKHVDPDNYDVVLEPSAGAGAFYDLLPEGRRLGLDIDPHPEANPGIQRMDFLEWQPARANQKILVVGNPPFGKNSSLAVKFFNRAATFAGAICFVLPRTFRKPSVVRRLDPYFHLAAEKEMPRDAFTFNDEPYDVPAVFQVWERRTQPRPDDHEPDSHPDFEFVNDRIDDESVPDFVLQRVGVNAGAVKDMGSHSSHYYIKMNVPGVREVMQNIDWTAAARNTAGNPSLSKPDVVRLYSLNKKK